MQEIAISCDQNRLLAIFCCRELVAEDLLQEIAIFCNHIGWLQFVVARGWLQEFACNIMKSIAIIRCVFNFLVAMAGCRSLVARDCNVLQSK